MICVILLNYKRMLDTEECILSLQKSDYPHFHIVVVDNCSDDDSVGYLRSRCPDVILLETEKNLGYAGGNNRGIQYALQKGYDYIFVLNNDTVVDRHCLSAFVESARLHPNKVLGGRIYQYYAPDKLQHLGGTWDQKKGKFITYPQDLNQISEKWDHPQEFDFIIGCSLFISASIFHQVGLFEEAFFLHYEEIDWCIRAKKKGFGALYVPTPKLWHKESASFVNPRPPQMYFQSRNRLFFLKRNSSKGSYFRWLICKFSLKWALLLFKIIYKTPLSLFSKKKRRDLLCYFASMRGIFDYFRGKLGNGPSWIYFT